MKRLIIARIVMMLTVAFIVLTSVYLWAQSTDDLDKQKKFLHNNLLTTSEQGLVSYVAQPYQVDVVNVSNTYTRYQSGAGLVFIKKTSVSNTVTSYLKATTNWSNRTSATYVPIND